MLPLVCHAQALAGQNLVDDLTSDVLAREGLRNQMSLGMGFRVTQIMANIQTTYLATVNAQLLAWLEAAPNQMPLLMSTTLFGKGNPNEDTII